MKKTRIGIFFGGRSAEHEISVITARNVAAALNPDRFEAVLVGIADDGRWILFPGQQIPPDFKRADDPRTASWPLVGMANFGGNRCGLVHLATNESKPLDVAFPLMHGPYGEDGSIQGLFRTLGLPFVGTNVLGSAIGMDKDVMKGLLIKAGLPTSPYRLLTPEKPLSFRELSAALKMPFFIKPANMGSSVGVFKIKSEAEFNSNLKEAFRYDSKVIAEEFIQGREIEIGVLGNRPDLFVSVAAEIIPQHEFYSYQAKYQDENGAVLKVPAELEPKKLAELQELAKKVFTVLEADGFARVDFFLRPTGEFFVNEINTIPGFTSISMYPRMLEASGYSYSKLVEKLVSLGLERHQREMKIQSVFPEA